jgi:flagellar biosynthesis/type III secretory pathway protein FliH
MSPSRFHEHLASGLDSDLNLPTSSTEPSKGKIPDSNRIDVMAQIRTATMTPTPLQELLKDPAVINTLYHTDGKKSRRQSSSSPRYSASTLMSLVVAEEEKQAQHLRSTLRSTGDRLDQEMRRANQAESKAEFAELRTQDLTIRLSAAETGKHYAELDALRANEEIRRHQMRIESLEKQVTKLQADIRLLERQRNEADESASRARDTARKFQIELSKQQAKEKVVEESSIYGRKKWFVTGHNEGWDAGYAEGFDDGREDGFEEGRQYGVREGRESGFKQGHKTGRKEGFENGREQEVDENDYTAQKKVQQWNERKQRSSSPAQLGPIWLKRPLYHDYADMTR